jgi:thioredoxin reductase (NADPH)
VKEAGRAYVQAQKFGAHMLIAKATGLVSDRKPYVIELENGSRISARTVVIATGAQYRKLSLESLSPIARLI